jgi:DNA-binding FrmR family transcriptional regulator
MAHTTRDKEKLLVRIRRIRGQVDALERALDREEDCSNILHLISGARGAMDGLMAEVLEGHIRHHVADPRQKPGSERAQATEAVIELIRSYLR